MIPVTSIVVGVIGGIIGWISGFATYYLIMLAESKN